jgi:predicted ATPase
MGGFKEVLSRGVHPKESIEIEIKFKLKIEQKVRLVTYVLEINEVHNQVFVKREILRYKRGASGKPFHFLDFSNGTGYAITNELLIKKMKILSAKNKM